MDLFKLSHFDQKVTLKKGQQCSYQCQQHPSAGKTSEFIIDSPKILQFDRAVINYKNPQHKTNPVPGGDEAAKIYFFEGLSEGTSLLRMKTYDKNQLIREQKIEITVE